MSKDWSYCLCKTAPFSLPFFTLFYLNYENWVLTSNDVRSKKKFLEAREEGTESRIEVKRLVDWAKNCKRLVDDLPAMRVPDGPPKTETQVLEIIGGTRTFKWKAGARKYLLFGPKGSAGIVLQERTEITPKNALFNTWQMEQTRSPSGKKSRGKLARLNSETLMKPTALVNHLGIWLLLLQKLPRQFLLFFLERPWHQQNKPTSMLFSGNFQLPFSFFCWSASEAVLWDQ